MLQKRMDQLDFAPILLGVLDVARRYHLEVPPQLVLLMKTLVHVEGLGRELYPALDIWSLGKPLLGSWLAARMTPAESLKSLVKQTPAMILGLADLPGLVWDSLNNLRNSGGWQERQWRELQQLQFRLAADRRRDWVALTGFTLGLTGILNSSGLSAALCLLVMVLAVTWRLLA